jgi:transketolase
MHPLSSLSQEIRKDILKMITHAKSGHPGGSLSCVEILVALFFDVLNKTLDLNDPDRDRFVLSKGHAVPTFYACLAKKGLISDEELKTLRQLDSRLQGHPDRVRMPILEASTGSLGQGLSIAQGIALGQKKGNTFCLIGDGEIQEGQIWEALMSAPKFHLSNLCVILDYNHAQIDGTTEQVMPIEPIADKVSAFGWKVSQVNGHDFSEIIFALKDKGTKPHFVIAQTVKGKGVSFMENNIAWHGAAPSLEQLQAALQELQ